MNTGNLITVTLKLKNVTQGTYPGVTKPNVPGDPDYIPPAENLTACPVSTVLSCPLTAASAVNNSTIRYEFSLPVAVLANTAVVKLNIILKRAGVTQATHTVTDFTVNFFSGQFTGLSSGTYTITLQYLNDSDTVLHTCTDTSTVVLSADVTWEGTDPYCETVGSCTIGTYDPETEVCVEVTTIAATPPGGGTPALAWHVSNKQWNNGGARIFAPGYASDGSGAVTALLTTPHFWVNGNFPWDTEGRNTTDSRMNAAGIWIDGETEDPLAEWIGFVRRVDVATARTVYIGICADNQFKFSLNGTVLVNCTGLINGGNNFNYMNIYPVQLLPGPNYIEMWGMNDGSVAGFACEIYDQSLASLMASTTLTDLNLLFSSSSLFGQPFDLGSSSGWSCPVGYSLDNTGPGDPVCVQISTTPATAVNTGYVAYENRRRLVGGVPDGYSEPNTETGGLGPYVPPEVDTGSCPLPEGIAYFQVGLGATEEDVCASRLYIVYTNESDTIVTGVTVYSDTAMLHPVTGYSYIKDISENKFELNSTTGVIGATAGTCTLP